MYVFVPPGLPEHDCQDTQQLRDHRVHHLRPHSTAGHGDRELLDRDVVVPLQLRHRRRGGGIQARRNYTRGLECQA